MAKRARRKRCCYCAGEGKNKYLLPDNEHEVEVICEDCNGTGKLCVLCGGPFGACCCSRADSITCARCGRYEYACNCKQTPRRSSTDLSGDAR